jgi:hypothetical protein
MQLALNIEHFAKPVIAETRLARYVSNFLFFLQSRVVKSLHKDIDNLILAVEGFYFHAKELSPAQADLVLKNTKRVILKLDKMDEEMQSMDYLNDVLLKEKIKYMLKSVYKMEGILHKAVYKSAVTQKVSDELTNGVAKMNGMYLSKMLSV